MPAVTRTIPTRRSVVLVAATLAAAAAGLLAAPALSVPATAASPTPASQLNVVGGPVAAEGAAVVITVDASHNMHLEGIAPDTKKILWSHPYSESAITPGVAPTVYAIGNNIIDLVPASKASSPLVNIEGINATTGAIAWNSVLRGVVLTDQPSPCVGKKDLCVIGFNRDGSTTMVILNPLTGAPVVTRNGPFRSMDTDIYQTAAHDPLVERLSLFGTIAWSKQVSTLMGGPGFNPDFGWDLNSYGSTEVATIGSTSTNSSVSLDNSRTIGFSLADGTVTWRQPGAYQCGGALQFVTPVLLCVFHGTAASAKPKPKTIFKAFKGMSLTLEGIDPASGTINWSLPVKNVDAIANGKVEFTDDTHLLVQQAAGNSVLLNADTGKTAAVPKGQVFWCTSIAPFKVNESKSINPSQERIAGNTYFPCTAAGKVSQKLPASSPSAVGVTIDGIFLWAAPHGLASRVVGSAHGVA